ARKPRNMSRKKNRSQLGDSRSALKGDYSFGNPVLTKLFKQMMSEGGFAQPGLSTISKADEWHDAYCDAIETIPESLADAFHRHRRITYQVTHIYSSGMIVAHCIDADAPFKVF